MLRNRSIFFYSFFCRLCHEQFLYPSVYLLMFFLFGDTIAEWPQWHFILSQMVDAILFLQKFAALIHLLLFFSLNNWHPHPHFLPHFENKSNYYLFFSFVLLCSSDWSKWKFVLQNCIPLSKKCSLKSLSQLSIRGDFSCVEILLGSR